MAARIDAVGNVIGRYEAPPVRRAGGADRLAHRHRDRCRQVRWRLGVLAGIAAVETLHRSGERLPVALEVIAFGDEEGVRFPTALTGSRALAGTLDPNLLDARDDGGIAVHEALREAGCDARAYASCARRAEDVLGLSRGPHRAGPRARGRGPAARHRHRDQRCDPRAHPDHGRGRPCRHRADGSAPRRARRGRRDDARGRARGPGERRTSSRPSARSRRCPARSTSCPARSASRSTSARLPTRPGRRRLPCSRRALPRSPGGGGVEVTLERFHDAAGCDLRSGADRDARGRGRPRRHRAAPVAERRRPRRDRARSALPDRDAVRALPGRHQPPPGRSDQRPRTPTSRCACCWTCCARSGPRMAEARRAAPLWLDDPHRPGHGAVPLAGRGGRDPGARHRPAACCTWRRRPRVAELNASWGRTAMADARAVISEFLAPPAGLPRTASSPGWCACRPTTRRATAPPTPNAPRSCSRAWASRWSAIRCRTRWRARTAWSALTNLVVRHRFGEGPTIALNAHGDVVPPGEGWTRDPYGAEVVDGWMYGRGVAVSKSRFCDLRLRAAGARGSGARARRHGRAPLHLRRGGRRRDRPEMAARARHQQARLRDRRRLLLCGRHCPQRLPASRGRGPRPLGARRDAVHRDRCAGGRKPRAGRALRRAQGPGCAGLADRRHRLAAAHRRADHGRHQHQRRARPHQLPPRPAHDPRGGRRSRSRPSCGR